MVKNKFKTIRTLLFISTFFILNSIFYIAHATIRYVSTTGNSIPPYTTWETAADSIQKCINFSVAGDTIIVANGVYYESLVVDKYLWLIGSSMDSTIIDGTGLAYFTVDFQSDGNIRFFTIKGKDKEIVGTSCIWIEYTNALIDFCRILNADAGISLVLSTSVINQCIITNVSHGCYTGSIDTFHTTINNSIIFINNSSSGITIFEGGKHSTLNNIILGNNSGGGINIISGVRNNIIKNNIVSGFNRNIEGFASDSAIIHNNVSSYANQRGFIIGSKTDMRNNISSYNNVGVVGPTDTNSDYNLYWQNNTHTGVEGFAEHDIVADPMFVNDTIPVYEGSYDYHLQAYSPAIDAGDPNILDVDGSRSDIGVFGGPGGERYTYQDLAPKPPANLTAVYDSGLVKLTWNRNTEADFTATVFTGIQYQTLVADTFYYDDLPEKYIAGSYYYKLTAIDSAYHQSAASEEVHVMVTGAPEGPPIVIKEYKLLNNYPNPFNPNTKIPYRLKEGGYIKLMVYDIKGELLRVLVNEYQNAGYYEVEFSPDVGEKRRGEIPFPFATGYRGDIASGIYLYRIEVIGKENIPRFVDMGKMILLK